MSDPKNTTMRDNTTPTLTTESLGVVGAKAKDADIYGLVLDHKDISEAVAKALVRAGIDPEAICRIVSGVTKQGPKSRIEIHAELDLKKIEKKTDSGNFFEKAFNIDESNDSHLPKSFYRALANKAYHKHMNEEIMMSKTKKGTRKVISLEFDPEIFIAFAWDIPYDDYYYNLKAIRLGYSGSKERDKKLKNLSSKERKIEKIRESNYNKYNLEPCNIAVFWSAKNTDGFHPNQVTDYD